MLIKEHICLINEEVNYGIFIDIDMVSQEDGKYRLRIEAGENTSVDFHIEISKEEYEFIKKMNLKEREKIKFTTN